MRERIELLILCRFFILKAITRIKLNSIDIYNPDIYKKKQSRLRRNVNATWINILTVNINIQFRLPSVVDMLIQTGS